MSNSNSKNPVFGKYSEKYANKQRFLLNFFYSYVLFLYELANYRMK
jgi:hypothetical protein